MPDQFDRWRAALAGQKLDMGERGDPPSGYFRRNAGGKGWEAFAVWREPDGTLSCFRNIFGDGSGMTVEQIDDMFAAEVYAIPHAVYVDVAENGSPWPAEYTTRLTVKEAAAGIVMTPELGRAKAQTGVLLAENERAVVGDNSRNAAPHELLSSRIAGLLDERAAWLKSVGGAVATQEHADRAASFAEAFAALEKEASEAHRLAKEPFLTQGRAVDAQWKPVVAKADDAKRSSKSLVLPYLRKQEEAAREAAMAAQAKADATQAPVTVEPAKARAGHGRGVSLRTVRRAVVTDLPALATYIAGLNARPDFAELCRSIGEKLLKDGIDVPGAQLEERKEAA